MIVILLDLPVVCFGEKKSESASRRKREKKSFFRKVERDEGRVGKSAHLVGSRDVEDTVGVNVEGDLDLRNTTRSRRNTRKFELSEQVVVLGASTFSLEDLNENTGLVVGVGRESLGLLGRDSGVA